MAEIRWVDRDAEGKIKGHYARKQDWHKAEDFVTEDSAELLAFDAEMKAQQEADQKAAKDKDALIGKLSTDVASLTAELTSAQTKLSALDKLQADVEALKASKRDMIVR